MENIDWERCYKDTEKAREDLENKLKKEIKDKFNGEISIASYTGNYPPHISLMFSWKDDINRPIKSRNKEERTKIRLLNKTFSGICEQYHLMRRKGMYIPTGWGKKTQFTQYADYVTLNFDYNNYKIKLQMAVAPRF
jgi:hypothetical protein